MPSFRRKKSKGKYKAVFLQKDRDSYIEIDSCTIADIGKETFSYKSHSYEINLKNELFRDKKGYTILFYVFNGDMLSFNEAKALMNPEELDVYVEQNVYGQLARALRESLTGSKGGWLVPIIIGAILGVSIGYFIGMNYSPAHEVIRYINQTGIPPI